MKIYLAYLECDAGCQDRTIIGAFFIKEQAEKFSENAINLPDNKYFTNHGVEEIEVI